jgi:hypothetical protein
MTTEELVAETTKFTTCRIRGIRSDTAGALDIADTRGWVEVMCWGQVIAAVRMTDKTVKRMPDYVRFSNEAIFQAAQGACFLMREGRRNGLYH